MTRNADASLALDRDELEIILESLMELERSTMGLTTREYDLREELRVELRTSGPAA